MQPDIFFNHDLSYCNTMALSCVADVAIALENEAQIAAAIAHAKTQNLAPFVLSGGSNVILPSRLRACVLLPKFMGIDVLEEQAEHITLSVGGGQHWHSFVQHCLSHGWFGLENLALIPGLVGASPIQNIGAYGVQVSDLIDHVVAYDLETGERLIFDKRACQFAYRHSLFKQHPNRYLISRVVFTLHKDPNKLITSYGDVASVARHIAIKHGRTTITPTDVFLAVIQIRQSKLPSPEDLPNCGSFFQNPIITIDNYQQLKQTFAKLPCYAVDDHLVKIPAGWLIDQAGLKGKGVFPILTHTHQALVLTNHTPYRATQADIDAAQTLITQQIKDKFGIMLVREPVWVSAQGAVW